MRGFRQHQFGRTNQFNVNASLDGLIEKLRIRNRDNLADALEERLQAPSLDGEGHRPEVLSLILSLSEHPVDNARVEDLEQSRPATPSLSLQWKDISRDDPWTEEEIWDAIDYAAGSSDEECVPASTQSSESAATGVSRSSTSPHNKVLDVRPLLTPIDTISLSRVESVQAWRKRTHQHIELTELQLVRELSHTLRGLPSSIFKDATPAGALEPTQCISIPNCSEVVVHSVLERVAQMASNVNPLRVLVQKRSSRPLLQTFLEQVDQEIATFDRELARIERSLVDPKTPIVLSIVSLVAQIEELTPIFNVLNSLVDSLGSNIWDCSHLLLDHMFDTTCTVQFEGQGPAYQRLESMFCICLDRYLKDVHLWMTEGIYEDTQDVFVIQTEAKDVALSSFWHNKFVLQSTTDGVTAPKFLQPFYAYILSAGKSVALLKELGIKLPSRRTEPEARVFVNLQGVRGDEASRSLIPFGKSLQVALEAWMQIKQSATWPMLRSHLINKCGLLQVLNTLQIVYLSANGTIFDTLLEYAEYHLSWKTNPFLLASLVQSFFADQTSLDSRSLSLRLDKELVKLRGLRRLEAFQLNCALPWPVANIIRPESLETYRRVSYILMQIKSAINALSRLRLRPGLFDYDLNSTSDFYSRLQLRHRLIHVLYTAIEHLTQQIIDVGCRRLTQDMDAATSFDAMIEAHATFVEFLQRGCLLVPILDIAREAVVNAANIAVLLSESLANAAAAAYGEERENVRTMTTTQIQQSQKQLTQLVDVIVRQLRSASRSESGTIEAGWESLAQKLDWSGSN